MPYSSGTSTTTGSNNKRPLPCGVMEIAQSLPGVKPLLQTVAVTVRQFEISSGVCSRFRPHKGPLLRFWKMDPSSPGVVQTLAVTVRQFEISSGVSSRFKPQKWAFAAILEDGSVVTWGHAGFGGDSSAVQDQLRGVQQIQATDRAFAAILEDGSVVTWGDAYRGGDSSAVRDQLRGVQQIQATRGLCCDSGRWIRRDMG